MVHGVIRRSSTFNTQRIEHLYKDRHNAGVRFYLHYGDLTDSTNLTQLISQIRPDEIYNLGAMSHVKVSKTHVVRASDWLPPRSFTGRRALRVLLPCIIHAYSYGAKKCAGLTGVVLQRDNHDRSRSR